jgi:polysaccharide biosynthesis protein PslH
VRILCVATKPPWPAIDGGRLALLNTLEALKSRGHELALVAPHHRSDAAEAQSCTDALRAICEVRLVTVESRSIATLVSSSLTRGIPVGMLRHTHQEMIEAVFEESARWRPDVIHAEQLQAYDNCAGAARNIPVLLRMQNVESELWRQSASATRRHSLLGLEAKRLRRAEVDRMSRADGVVTLTDHDAQVLSRGLSEEAKARVSCAPLAFPSELPSNDGDDSDVVLTLTGSSGWWPNEQGARWFFERVWPHLRQLFPSLYCHVFGGKRNDLPGVVWHPSPTNSMDAFPANAIVIVPLHIASGIRIRILEAWARGLPVVATSAAARGLRVESDRELLVADSPDQFVDACARLIDDPIARRTLAETGRRYLRRYHDSTEAAAALEDAYRRAIAYRANS